MPLVKEYRLASFEALYELLAGPEHAAHRGDLIEAATGRAVELMSPYVERASTPREALARMPAEQAERGR